MRRSLGDFEEIGKHMEGGAAVRLTFDAGQQLNGGISSLFDQGLCRMTVGEKRKLLAGVLGVMGKPLTIILMPTDSFKVDDFATIMFEMEPLITDFEFVSREDWPVAAKPGVPASDETRSSYDFM